MKRDLRKSAAKVGGSCEERLRKSAAKVGGSCEERLKEECGEGGRIV